MKIKKSDAATVEKWIDVQLAKDDSFPFDPKKSEKASKKHLKALKAWRKCSRNAKEIREWCDEWLDPNYARQLEYTLESQHAHKADCPIKLTQEAYDLLVAEADQEDKSPSELLISRLSK